MAYKILWTHLIISSFETALGFFSLQLQDSQGGNEELVFVDLQPS